MRQYHATRCGLAPAASDHFKRGVIAQVDALIASGTLSAADAQLCHDLKRADRYQFRAISRLLELTARLKDEAARHRLVDEVEGALDALGDDGSVGDLRTALAAETAAQAAADPVQLATILSGETSCEAVERAIRRTSEHLYAVKGLLASLNRHRFRLIHGAHA